jgi:OOP family OmpA-OmpF porin
MAAALAVAGSFFFTPAANAGPDIGSWYVTPEALYVSPDHALDANNNGGYRFAAGRVLSPKWDLELGAAHSEHASGPRGRTGDLKLRFDDITLRRVFQRDQKINPFIDLALGLTRSAYYNSPGPSPAIRGASRVGLGFMAGAKEHARAQFIASAGVRFDKVRYNATMTDPYLSAGVRIYLGGAKSVAAAAPVAAAVAPPPPPPPPPADSDGDGVPDTADRCPNTPAGARVDGNGCEFDSDRDGVVDRLDACPNTPPGATVDAKGCELDADGDGVVDRIDRCPNTPRGDKVDAVGCGLTIALQVLFDTDSANIKSDSYGELDSFADFLKAVPSASGELQGHTDSVGSAAYNQKLSQRRADAVKAYVVGKGIDAARVTAKGYGESQPVADNKTPEGRAENRRVLFVRKTL